MFLGRTHHETFVCNTELLTKVSSCVPGLNFIMHMLLHQGRRRLLESGTAIEHRPHEGGERPRGGWHPSGKGGFGDLPQENFVIQDDYRSNFVALWDHFCLWTSAYFTCSIAIFQMPTTASSSHNHQNISNYFDPSVGLIRRWHQR